ncbi:hypothetical protein DSM112329_04105 [Paraconexibacter sp. AEG42_29]|uniref:DUF2207 domain-containing protein n=1 Tax=Paraconexibacter sp. AEG42_29 TaxID=2997339 RepID=A0AAU7AZZ0_9ACTN
MDSADEETAARTLPLILVPVLAVLAIGAGVGIAELSASAWLGAVVAVAAAVLPYYLVRRRLRPRASERDEGFYDGLSRLEDALADPALDDAARRDLAARGTAELEARLEREMVDAEAEDSMLMELVPTLVVMGWMGVLAELLAATGYDGPGGDGDLIALGAALGIYPEAAARVKRRAVRRTARRRDALRTHVEQEAPPPAGADGTLSFPGPRTAVGWRRSRVALNTLLLLLFVAAGAGMAVAGAALIGIPIALLFAAVVAVQLGTVARTPHPLVVDPAGLTVMGQGPIPWPAIAGVNVGVQQRRVRTLVIRLDEPAGRDTDPDRPWLTRRMRRNARTSGGAAISLPLGTLDIAIPVLRERLRVAGGVDLTLT